MAQAAPPRRPSPGLEKKRSFVSENTFPGDEESASRVQSKEDDFPEGGWRAWGCVVGAYVALCCPRPDLSHLHPQYLGPVLWFWVRLSAGISVACSILKLDRYRYTTSFGVYQGASAGRRRYPAIIVAHRLLRLLHASVSHGLSTLRHLVSRLL